MFYLLHGQDIYRSREKFNELVSHFKTKVSDLGFFRIEGENFSEAEFKELLRGKILFERKYVVVCEKVLENKEALNFILDNLDDLAKTDNLFLFWEEEIDEKTLEEFKKQAYKVQEYKPLDGVKLKAWFAAKKIPANIASEIIKKSGSDLWRASKEIEKYELGGLTAKQETDAPYNPFAICDAFAEKNKGKAWIIYQQALRRGISADEVFFKIHGSILSIFLLYFSPLEKGVSNQTEIICLASSKLTSSAGKDKTLVSSCSRDCLAVATSSAKAERTPWNLLAVISTPTPDPHISTPLFSSGFSATF